jgi:acetylornithine/N-succinyldiaminopimelate aminotransferase
MSHILPVYKKSPYLFVRGEGVYLYSDKNEKYLDFIAGIGVNSMGHSHPHLVEALEKQNKKLWHISNYYHIEGAEELAERITKASKFAEYIFFCNSGAEAVECGLKMIRKYHDENGHPERYRVITFEGAFHGRTLATISAAKKEKVMKGFEPAMDGFDQVPHGDIEAVKAAITPETGGILIEPVQGEGGIRPAPEGFLQALRKLCDEKGLLLMFDGVQCGMGRTGKLFSHEWWDTMPDITSSAKGIGGGFPLGACLSTKKVGDAMGYGSHGSTYASNPLAMAASNAVMDIMLAPGFLDSVVEKGKYFRSKLEALVVKHPDKFVLVRGLGLMLGIKLADKYDANDVVAKLRENKLLTGSAGENIIRFLPPLIAEKEHFDEAIEKLERTVTAL